MGEVFLQPFHCRFGNGTLREVCYFVSHDSSLGFGEAQKKTRLWGGFRYSWRGGALFDGRS
jgi:hypothetical protein